MIVFLFINQAILLLGQCTRLGAWKGMPLKGVWWEYGWQVDSVFYGEPGTGTLTLPKPWTLTLTLTTKPTYQPNNQPTNQPANHPANQSINQPSSRRKQPTNKPNKQSNKPLIRLYFSSVSALGWEHGKACPWRGDESQTLQGMMRVRLTGWYRVMGNQILEPLPSPNHGP